MAVQGHRLGTQFPSDEVHFLAVVVKRVTVEIAGTGLSDSMPRSCYRVTKETLSSRRW